MRGITVSRKFQHPINVVFDAWVDPDMRRTVLLRSTYKNCIKEISVVEGGIERYEDRWKNSLYGTRIRKYLSIVRPTEVIAEVQYTPNKANLPRFIPQPGGAWRERVLFEETPGGTNLTVFEDVIEPGWLKAAQLLKPRNWENDWWRLDLDVFEKALKERENS